MVKNIITMYESGVGNLPMWHGQVIIRAQAYVEVGSAFIMKNHCLPPHMLAGACLYTFTNMRIHEVGAFVENITKRIYYSSISVTITVLIFSPFYCKYKPMAKCLFRPRTQLTSSPPLTAVTVGLMLTDQGESRIELYIAIHQAEKARSYKYWYVRHQLP